jgi:hypothetical protein
MSHMSKVAFLVSALCLGPTATQAGWIVEWEHTPIKSNGDRGTTEPVTMRIEKGKVRLGQPSTTSVIDYNKSQFTLLNPQRQYFWSGTVDEYVAQMLKTRSQAAKRKRGEESGEAMPALDLSSLPSVAIAKAEGTEKIAGHTTIKYDIKVDDVLFEELWIADDLDLSSDIDAKKVLAYQKKMSGGMIGNSAKAFNALYHNPEYQKLREKGFVLRAVTHHIAGGFERVAVEVKNVEIPESEFVVPENYRKVRLSDVFSTGKTS